MCKVLNIILCTIALVSCAHTSTDNEIPAAEMKAQTFVYECTDDFSFVARIETDRAWLFLPGNTIDLPQVPSASGKKYSNGSDTFWSKAEESIIEADTVKHAGCRNNRAKAIWEHAKLNGVDFRALGNEPGWYMEISNKHDILLVTDYGQRTYQFTTSTIKPNPQSKTTVYNARNDDNLVEIEITAVPCQDSMSGEKYSSTVSIRVNDKRYNGCGKPLH